jgi:hypothetical protein
MTTRERHGHPAVLAANDLHTIAGDWPDLVARVARGLAAVNGERVHGTPAPPAPVDTTALDVVIKVETWANHAARTLHTETDWSFPADTTTPGILRALAARVGHFTADPDTGDEFCAEADRLARLVDHTAHPTGRRRLHIGGAHCIEPGCTGTYTVLADPTAPCLVPDLICDHDRAHRIDPVEWQRAYRRTGDPTAAVRAIARWRRNGAPAHRAA